MLLSAIMRAFQFLLAFLALLAGAASSPDGMASSQDGTCITQVVIGNDTCDSLASACGIDVSSFNKFNAKLNACSALTTGQLVCCSDGSLPDTNDHDPDGGTDDEIYIDPNYWPGCAKDIALPPILVPAHCTEQNILTGQITVFEKSLQKYKDLIDHDYDQKFGVYERYAKAQVPDQLNNFLASDKVDKYFKCQETKDVFCCNDCYKGACRGPCEAGPSCQSGPRQVDMDKCPKYEFEAPALSGGLEIPNATYSLTDSKGFYADILATWGIDESWVTLGKRQVKVTNGCQYSQNVPECQDSHFIYFYNYPLATNIQIYNPKKVTQDAIPTASDLLNRVKLVASLSAWDETSQLTNLVDATSVPTYTLQQSVESMQNITEKADDIKKQEREQFILNFLSSMLFIIPIAGEAAGSAGLTVVANLLRLIGVTGEAGMLLHDVIADPSNSFISIFAFLAGAGVGGRGFSLAAASRRSMKAADLERLGTVKGKLNEIESVRARTC
jgi:hypothetical protein